jgi:TetR/AcrR family transcriptional regulator, cholesterol catabolism regulator
VTAAIARRRKSIPISPNSRLRQIIDEAASLFDRQGYNRVNMEEIAAAVGLHKASLYHHIKSKDEILVLIHQEFMALIHEKARATDRLTLPPTQQLVEIMNDIFSLMQSHRGHVRVFFEHHRELPARSRAKIAAERDQYESIVRDILARGIESGEFRRVDTRLAALAMFGMSNWAYQWYKPSGTLTPRDLANTFASYLLTGIRSNLH